MSTSYKPPARRGRKARTPVPKKPKSSGNAVVDMDRKNMRADRDWFEMHPTAKNRRAKEWSEKQFLKSVNKHKGRKSGKV